MVEVVVEVVVVEVVREEDTMEGVEAIEVVSVYSY